jgi:SAM-dependent methyltransferase
VGEVVLLTELSLAIDVVGKSGPAALVVVSVIALAALAVMAMSVQVAAPGASLISCLTATSQVSHRELTSIMRAIAAPVATVLAIGAGVLLLARDHVAGNTPALSVAWLALASAAASIAISRARTATARSSAFTRRIPHLCAATLVGEVLFAAAVTIAAWAMSHTAGVPISPLEAFAAVILARALTFLPWLPAGAPVADVAMVLTLHAIGAPTEAAIATALLWRLALSLTAIGTWLASRAAVARKPLPEPDHAGSRLGEYVHRSVFRALSALPSPISKVLRRLLFDAVFRLSDDPWDYDCEPYEQRKRMNLLRQLPADARVVLEVGCAEGHNLRAIARAIPEAHLIGIDISQRAVDVAIERAIQDDLSMEIICIDARHANDALAARDIGPVDLVVIAETLYYLGGPERVAAELHGLRGMLSSHATIVLLHPERDAQHLHAAALRALGAQSSATHRGDDPERPYLVEVARVQPTSHLIE